MKSKEEKGIKRLSVPTHVDLQKFTELETQGYLRSQSHPSLPLKIWNYTQNAMFESVWTEETLMARGLVVHDSTGEIVARPMKKFWNFEEHYGPLPDGPYHVWEKVDGSLILYFHYMNEWHFATKGSFTSSQALEARKIWEEKYSHVSLDTDYTYLFEVIYPENRIVLDYGDKRDLVFLVQIHTKNATEILADSYYSFPIPEYFGLMNSKENPIDLKFLEVPNKEGFILIYNSGLRLKLKFDEYLRLHKVMTGFTEKNIWESLKNGGMEELERVLDRVPDEFYKWVKEISNDLLSKYKEIESVAIKDFVFVPDGDRAHKAEYIKKTKYPSLLFSMLDQKDYSENIWKMIKPEKTTVFKVEW